MAASRAQIESLYREHYLGFRRGFAALTGSYETAHDVVQEAFARALAQRRQFRNEGSLRAWVWQIATRVMLDERRRPIGTPIEDVLEEGLVEPARDPELSAALRGLPPRRRLVFFLRYFADMSYSDIASICGISEGTVAASIAQARAALVEALSDSESLSEKAER
jgi:RNA polymerase sigma-70 factor (ECF subfamily)